jgi:hypothetical protein
MFSLELNNYFFITKQLKRERKLTQIKNENYYLISFLKLVFEKPSEFGISF